MFHSFKSTIDHIAIPEKFTFPFYYEPHTLSLIAVQELQQYLTSQLKVNHNFGLASIAKKNTELNQEQDKDTLPIIGKMFGVLVVQKASGEIGYLCAFSGKLAEQNHLKGFVPPVFDMLNKGGFFLNEQKEINTLNAQIEALEKTPNRLTLNNLLRQEKENYQIALDSRYTLMAYSRRLRKEKRQAAEKNLSSETQNNDALLQQLANESISEKKQLKILKTFWQEKITHIEEQLHAIEDEINIIKKRRKQRSSNLQRKLFKQYKFSNINNQFKDLRDIFQTFDQQPPPAGAGECAAPKLLQFAFENDLAPIAMAEFWWGASPKSEIRKHQHFYPACRGKCRPILHHMLSDMIVDDDLIQVNTAENIPLEIIYQDDDIVVVNKPPELLSVPGKTINDSVYTRIKKMYPQASGSLIVHRLDMSTSGLLVLALNSKAHKGLQMQFIEKQIEKRYIALLDGIITEDKGEITLPLRVDLDDRPRQLVCEEHGKHALTHWQVISQENNTTRVYLYPRTGRTHQLRVHCSHVLGLNTAIVGDDLYGKRNKRLCLHAEYLAFNHPVTKKALTFQVTPNF